MRCRETGRRPALPARVTATGASSHRGQPPVFCRASSDRAPNSHTEAGRETHFVMPATPGSCLSAGIRLPLRRVARQCSGELIARGELELAEDAREVPLDRARRDEQRLGDLSIRQVLARELGDTALARRERFDATEDDAPRPRSGCPQLYLCARRKRSG